MDRLVVIRVGASQTIGLEGYHEAVAPRKPSPLGAFLVEERPVLWLRIRRGTLSDFPRHPPIFDSLGLWRVHQHEGSHVFVMQVNAFSNPYAVARIDFDSMQGEIVISTVVDKRVDPFEHPLCGILFSKLIADSQGIIVHACGLDLDGRGILFVGTSGSGKSTLAGIFSQIPGARILSDERTVVCMEHDRLVMYGTPWPGTAGLALPISVPLERVFFLGHAGHNKIEPITELHAALEMTASSFLPYWNQDSSERALACIERIVHHVPMSVFGFVPNVSAVDFVRSLL